MRFSGLLGLSLLLLTGTALHAQQPETVTVGVLSLFHSQTLTLTTAQTAQVRMDADTKILPAESVLTLRKAAGGLTVQSEGGPVAIVRELSLAVTTMTVTVPGKLSRRYTGALTVTATPTELRAVVAMPIETAVASIVAAESAADAAPEALKAQAIVARSYLLASPHRHRDFVACDTTHCQYLRAVPPPGSVAALATAATSGMVLTWQARIVAAMYSRSCGGSTRVPDSVPPGAYPFFSVRCDYCRRHPERWSREVSQTPPVSERARIAFGRQHGWAAIPSTSFRTVGTRIDGRGVGHGLGLCQVGAQSLALRGWSFSAILNHYFPAAAITRRR